MATGRHFAILAALLAAALDATGASAPMTPAQREGAAFLDSLSIPCPGEVFAALNRACRPNWATLVTPATAPVSTDRAQLALAVGILAADGYVAVEAQDGQQVKNIGREIIAMAKALGVSQSLLGRGSSLVEFADNNAWEALSSELEATEAEVKATLTGQKDRDLVLLTSVAAWVRGLEIAAAVIQAGDSPAAVGVIRQPGLAATLASQLEQLPERTRNGARVVAVRDALAKAAALLGANASPEVEKRNLAEIHDACAAAVREIMGSAKVTATPVPSPLAPSPVPSDPAAPSPAPQGNATPPPLR